MSPDRAAAPRRAAARVAAVGASVVLALLAAEAALRALGLPRLRYDSPKATTELDPELLYRVPGGSRSDVNALGFRDREFAPRDPRRRRVLMVGDSFVMGLNLRSERTLPKRLEARLGRDWEVLNFGVYGYGPDQEYLRLEREGLALDPDVVVLVLYPSNDFSDLAKNGLFELDDAGRLRPTATNPVREALARPRLGMLLRRAATGHFLPPAEERALMALLWGDTPDTALMLDPAAAESRRKVALLGAILERFRETLAARQVGFGVVVMPSAMTIQSPRRMHARFGGLAGRQAVPERLALDTARRLGVDVLDLTPGFLAAPDAHLYAQRDFHLSRRGAEVAARLLAPWVAGLAPGEVRSAGGARASRPG